LRQENVVPCDLVYREWGETYGFTYIPQHRCRAYLF
jgi:hypothetical protein